MISSLDKKALLDTRSKLFRLVGDNGSAWKNHEAAAEAGAQTLIICIVISMIISIIGAFLLRYIAIGRCIS